MIVKARPNFDFEFVLPLADHAGRRGDEDEIDPPPQQQFAQDEPRLDRLAGADVVGDQQIHAGKAQRLSQGEKLIGVLMDAGPERRLKEVAVGGGRRVPAQRAQIRGKDARVVGPEFGDGRPIPRRPELRRRVRRPKGQRRIRLGRRRRCRRGAGRISPSTAGPSSTSQRRDRTRTKSPGCGELFTCAPRSVLPLPPVLDQTGSPCAIGSATRRGISMCAARRVAPSKWRPTPSRDRSRARKRVRDRSASDTADASLRYAVASIQVVRMRSDPSTQKGSLSKNGPAGPLSTS